LPRWAGSTCPTRAYRKWNCSMAFAFQVLTLFTWLAITRESFTKIHPKRIRVDL